MIIGSIFKIAFDAIRANKLRSGLTLLGIMIGVTSVMTIMSALEGMAASIEKDLGRLGPYTFMVERIGIITSEEMFLEKIKRKPLDMDARELIEEGCEDCEKVGARVYTFSKIKYRNQTLRDIFIAGMTSNMVDIVDFEVARGRFVSFEDDLYSRKVCLIGDLVREQFFENVEPLGKEIKIGPVKYTVVGVFEKQGSSFGQSRDNFVVIPMNSHIHQYGRPERRLTIFVKAFGMESLQDAMDETRMILRAQRHVPYNKDDDFDLLTADNILEMINSFTRILRMGLVGISSISLVVGGIVVMNIMMVSVTERTREIGIRKSIGAKQSHIRLQFLFESLILTMSGGLIGIVLGYIAATYLIGLMGMEMTPSLLAIFSGLSISTGTGLIFGIYPAIKAARLDPIKALSYE